MAAMVCEVDSLGIVRFDTVPDTSHGRDQPRKDDDRACRQTRKQRLHQMSNSDHTGQWSDGFSIPRMS